MPVVIATIRQLQPTDKRSSFCAGNVELDRFFWQYAGQNRFLHHLGTTYVACTEPASDGEASICGFFTVAMSELAVSQAPASKKRSPHYPLPMLRLARMAVDQRYRGRGVGKQLLRAVLLLALDVGKQVACAGVVVDAKPEAVPFYESLGFIVLHPVAGHLGDRPQPIPMTLEIGQIRACVSG